MTDKNIDKAKGRVKGAASARTGGRRPQNKGRVDQAKSSVKKAVDTVAAILTGRKRNNKKKKR